MELLFNDINQAIQEDIRLISEEAQNVIEKAGQEIQEAISELEERVKNIVIIGGETVVYVVDRITNLVILVASIISFGGSATLFTLRLIKYGLPDGFARTLVLTLMAVAMIFFGLMLIPAMRARVMAFTGVGLKQRLELLDLGDKPSILGMIPDEIIRTKTRELNIIGANLLPDGKSLTARIDDNNLSIAAADPELIVVDVSKLDPNKKTVSATLELYYDNVKGPTKVVSIKQAPVPAPEPDLVISHFTIKPLPPIKGENADVLIKVKNVGQGPVSKEFLVEWRPRADEAGTAFPAIINGLNPNEEREIQFAHAYARGGEVESIAIADPDHRVQDEKKKTNNKRSLRFRIKELPEKMDYFVRIKTGNIENAGTDARVFLTLFGDKGESIEERLDTPNHDDFVRNATDVFTISTDYLGELTKLRIRHDNSGDSPGWNLDYIEIQEKEADKRRWNFPAYRWLAVNMDDGSINRLLNPGTSMEYELRIKTGNVDNAGTDAGVFIKLFGEKGESGEQQLDNPGRDDFKRNSTDAFRITSKDLGKLTKLRIRHNNSGDGPGWFLDYIDVTEVKQPKRNWHFPCNRWLAVNMDDRQIDRTLFPR
ncbi:MAG: hypothetical protein JSW07_07815 [bacterium]|nr:MAG: hypothetical protein JSW07_07815 [bacterium]